MYIMTRLHIHIHMLLIRHVAMLLYMQHQTWYMRHSSLRCSLDSTRSSLSSLRTVADTRVDWSLLYRTPARRAPLMP